MFRYRLGGVSKYWPPHRSNARLFRGEEYSPKEKNVGGLSIVFFHI